MNDSQLARCSASVERFPLSSRPMVEKRFSTGTDEALRVRLSNSLQLLPDLEIVLSSTITVDCPLDLLERIIDSYLFHF